MATRHAIGADFRRLARQLLTETTLLSVAGGTIGLLLGWWALRLVPTLGLDEMPRGHEIGLDQVSAAVILSVAVGVGLLIGLMPVAPVRALPGVESAGVTSTVPMSGDHSDSVILAEGYQMKEGESLVSPSQSAASGGYFETMKIGLVHGRFFNASDTSTATRAIIVDERMVAHFWPGQDPLGRRMYQPGSAERLPEWRCSCRPSASTVCSPTVWRSGVVRSASASRWAARAGKCSGSCCATA